MTFHLSPTEARRIKAKLLNAPVAPVGLAHVINVGTDGILDVLEQQYFSTELPEGISCFKYLEGDYGTGKTQFIECLSDRARKQHIVTALVTIDEHCPFSSPLAIFQSVVSSFVPSDDSQERTDKGIEVLLRSWIRAQLSRMGVTPGDAVPDNVRQHLLRPFESILLGAPDPQMAAGVQALGRRMVALESGAQGSSSDSELVSWVRGGKVTSKTLKDQGMYEYANEANAFARLKTAIQYLRHSLGYKGVFVAFDEGTRTGSFRRGSVKQRQAIENMLSLINQNAEGDFGGAMFLYAATPDFRTEVIRNYRALVDRIGSVAFVPGQPMTPLITLDSVNTDGVLEALGDRLLDVFEAAGGPAWNRGLQHANLRLLVAAEKQRLAYPTTLPPRYFVFHCCQFLESQRTGGERVLNRRSALDFVGEHLLSDGEEAV